MTDKAPCWWCPTTVLDWWKDCTNPTCPDRKAAQVKCLPECHEVHSLRIASGPLQGDQIDHASGCPNAAPSAKPDVPAMNAAAMITGPVSYMTSAKPETEEPIDWEKASRWASGVVYPNRSIPEAAECARAFRSLTVCADGHEPIRWEARSGDACPYCKLRKEVETLRAACRLVDEAHTEAFVVGQPLVYANGRKFDHGPWNDAAHACQRALREQEKAGDKP